MIFLLLCICQVKSMLSDAAKTKKLKYCVIYSEVCHRVLAALHCVIRLVLLLVLLRMVMEMVMGRQRNRQTSRRNPGRQTVDQTSRL